MKKLFCATLLLGAMAVPTLAMPSTVSASVEPNNSLVKIEGCTMPNCVGDQYQNARDGLIDYFKYYGVTADVDISFVPNSDPNLSYKVKAQDIPAGTELEANTSSTLLICLQVYDGANGEPKPLEKDECAMPNCVGDQYQNARDGLIDYFKYYGVTANVDISFVPNSDPNLSYKVKAQDIPADTGLKTNTTSTLLICLQVYDGANGEPKPLEKDECAMPNCVGDQYQNARDGLIDYFKYYGVTANVDISFVPNSDPNLSYKVKAQDIPAGTGLKTNTTSTLLICLQVYDGANGEPKPLEKDECAMPNCVGDQYQNARDGLIDYFKGYGVTVNVECSLVPNTDPKLENTVKAQDIPAGTGLKTNTTSTLLITLQVYDKVSTQTTSTTTATSATKEADVKGFVDRLYSSVLNRDPEDEGAKFWANELTSQSLTGAEVAEKFVLSKEFTDKEMSDKEYLTVLYKAFFNREPDADGLNYWLNNMKNGMKREAVEKQFVYSQEWADTCAAYGIRSGSDTQPTQSVTPSEATLAFVERMYTKAMNRESDPEGKAYWAALLANKQVTGESVGLQFFDSAEMKGYNLTNEQYLTRLYATFMDRDPEEEGMKFWMKALDDGMERADVVKEFAKSPEFNKKCTEAGIKPC